MAMMMPAHDLLKIVEECSATITLSTSDGPEWQRTSETMEVIDAKQFRERLTAYIEKTTLDAYSYPGFDDESEEG